jgi:xanthine dehydrogenase iron-sulfur cluster and FAD-binding subunit A
MWKHYFMPESVEALMAALDAAQGQTKIIAGGTDLMVEIRNGKWPDLSTVIDISRLQGLDQIWKDDQDVIHIEAAVTHSDVLQSPILRELAHPLVQACYKVATPQLRNRATVVGNLVTASPANDTITPLMAMDAKLVLVSSLGQRTVPLRDFYLGVRKTVLAPNEFVMEVNFPALKSSQQGSFMKQALRRTQAISVLNCCVLLHMENELIQKAVITMGSVAPTIIHAQEAEAFLVGKKLENEVIKEASRLAAEATRPISDVRASDEYRLYMMEILVEDGLKELKSGAQLQKVPVKPVALDTKEGFLSRGIGEWDGETIQTTINGHMYVIDEASDMTLLNLVRERIGFTGTKVGCEEGECGACTLFLDGKAVVSCLVPAPRAHLANITTVEGVAEGEKLHPVQQAFVDHGAVQCGYCTPGFVMAGVKLLQEDPNPSREKVKEAISGNLCRCTGYYKIIEAIEAACEEMRS